MVQHSSIDHGGLLGIAAYGSNSNSVGYANAPGASSSNSRADHVHLGVLSVAHTSNTFSGPVILTASGFLGITSPTPGTINLSSIGDGAGGSSGLADQGTFTYLDATEAAAPGTPAAGKARIYAKTDGRIYSKDDAGVEYGPFDVAGGSGTPLLIADYITASAYVDAFTNAALTGWTTGGSPTAAAVTTESYDATCIDLTLPAQSDRIYKACPAGDFTAYLTIHGISNSTPSPSAARNGMIALVFTDASGNGTGMSVYDDGQTYMWGVVSNAYNSSGSTLGATASTPPLAAEWPIVYRLAKVGTTITGGISVNGGASWLTATRTDSTTFTRMGVTRLYSGGGTNPKIRIGRFNTA